MSVPSQAPPYYGSTQTYIYYPDPALPLSTVNYCAQSCDVLLFRKQPNDRSGADSMNFKEGKTLLAGYSNTTPPVQGTPFPTFRSHTDYIKYKRAVTVLTQNYASDTQQ
jgi:hypothetical protein|uniref:Uncharacterized protein n=1 Tax=viral metagenome TaxID=1070528 RepID=A0A6C0LMD4_9ZZZZ